MTTEYYRGKKILVTGGTGFLGFHLAAALLGRGARVRIAGRRPRPATAHGEVEYVQADLRERAACERAVRGIDLVFHLAATGGGLHANLQHQPQLLTDNVLLNTTVLDTAYRAGVSRYLYTSSSAVYPGHLEELEEDAPWDEPPHASESAFGWAKRLGEIQARTYYEHWGMPIAIVRPANPYGPHDTFDPAQAHVIPALIRRARAREHPFVVWGTGRAVRSFVHARDVARGMLVALERHPVAEPINLASPETVSIVALVKLVLELIGSPAAVLQFDTSKPDGHPRKVPSVRRAAQHLGLTDYISLRDGLQETIAWYATDGADPQRNHDARVDQCLA